MNYTQNHHLPQWVKSDPIRMDDFNQMNQNIEAGLNANAAKADAAQSAANAAQATADRALSSSSGGTSHRYMVGTYIGDGKEHFIELTFEPDFLIITRVEANGDNDFVMVGMGNRNSRCKIVERGFWVYGPDSAHPEYPNLNMAQKKYEYISFI